MRKFKFLVVLLSCLIISCNHHNQDCKSDKRTISVSGESEVKIIPDILTFNVGVQTWNKDVSQAKAENDRKIKEVVSILKKSNIEEKYIQTNNMSITPTYQEHKNYTDVKINGYTVNNTINIELKEITKLDQIISEMTKVGISDVLSFNLNTSEPRKYKDQARKMAVEAALQKATAMADALGMKILKPIEINETSSSFNYNNQSSWGRGTYSLNKTSVINYEPDNKGKTSEFTTQKGQISVTAKVYVLFEME